jgi:hypothetical protein
VKHPKHPQTKAQHAASAKWAKAGRSKQAEARAAAIATTGKPPARSKKQNQTVLRWAAAGRAAQARTRAGLKPLPKKKPALALDTAVLPGGLNKPAPPLRPTGHPGLHDLPVCAAVAVAEHLLAAAGVFASDADILGLAVRAAGGCLPDYLAEAAAGGLAGRRLLGFWPCDPGLLVPGLLYGVQFRQGYHTVLAHPLGMISWGMLMPVTGVPTEAWYLDWDSELS